MHVALQIVAKAMFGAEIGDEADDLAPATLTVLDHIMVRARARSASLPTLVAHGCQPPLLAGHESAGRRRRNTDRSPSGAASGASGDLLSTLMQAQDAETGHRMTDQTPARRSDDHAHRRARDRRQRPGVDVVSAGRRARMKRGCTPSWRRSWTATRRRPPTTCEICAIRT